MGAYRIATLGPLEVTHEGEHVPLRPTHGPILARLALGGATVSTCDALIDAVWGERPPATARNTLQVHISRIRSAAPGLVVTVDDGYRLDPDLVACDHARFTALADEALQPADPTAWQSIRKACEAALDLWRDEPFPELPDDLRAIAMRARLDELRLTLTERRLEAMLALGLEEAALADLRALVEVHPLRERLWEYLMVCHYRLGRQAEALRAYRRVAAILGDELGVEPGPRLRTLEEEILRHVPGAGQGSLAATPTNLPRPAAPILGREEDAERLMGALRHHGHVLLTGESGVGKTRLAVDVGWRMLDELAGGVFMVDLTNAADEPSMVAAIATTLRLTSDVGGVSLLGNALRDRPTLLILDGADHLRTPLSVFTARASGTTGPMILTTSRTMRKLPTAHTERLGPLPVTETGSDGEVRSAPALQLLLDRARAASSDFRAEDVPLTRARRVLERTGGNPLALEIAGRWVATLGADAYLELRERFPEAGADGDIELAVEALAPVDREFLVDISVVAGHGSLATFEAIGAPTRNRVELAGSVARLVDAGLLTTMVSPTGTVRYAMPAAISEIVGAEADRRDHVDEVHGRHAEHFLAVAQGLDSVAITDIDAMMPDFRLALEWWLVEDPTAAAGIANALAHYWVAQYLARYGLGWYERILDAVAEPDLETLWWSGWVAYNANEHAMALDHYRIISERAAIGSLDHARASYGEARISVLVDRAGAVAKLQESLTVFRREESMRETTECLMALGLMEAWAGNARSAAPLLEEALELLGDTGDARQRSICHRYLSLAAYHDGRVDPARSHADRAVEIARGAADTRIRSGALLQFALVEATWGATDQAARAAADAFEPIPADAWYDTALVLNGVLPVLVRAGALDVARDAVAVIDDIWESSGWEPLHDVNPVYAAVRASVEPVTGGARTIPEVRRRVEQVLGKLADA